MFGKSKLDLTHEIETLKERLKASEMRAEHYKERYNAVLECSMECNIECSCVFDFKNPYISVLSIERLKRDDMWVTNIGYFKTDNTDTVHEWFMITTREQHEELVRQFEELCG